MADISYIKIIDGTTHSIHDIGVPELTQSTSTYLRGDGDWIIPTVTMQSGVTFVDGGDHLLVNKQS